MKKRIFIEAHYLEIGGAEISLIGLLNAIDYSRYEVDLFLYSHRGELMKLIPSDVHVLPEIPAYTTLENPLKEVFYKGYWRQGLARVVAKLKYHKWAKQNNPQTPEAFFQFLDNEIMPTLPSLHHLGEYDLAVNFIALKNHIPTKVHAKKTVTWIHTDYSTIPVNPELELPAWDAYDYIASISQEVKSAFLVKFPMLEEKIIDIENILSPNFVKHRSEEFDASQEFTGSINLLSIGRYCQAKNYDNLPDIARRIIRLGISDLKWYIIGYGDDTLIRQKIAEAGMEKNVILLGKKTNPYPYIKACDIYVQPSRYEGKSITVREAQILCKPVVITNYTTASSQVSDGVDGIIVPMDNEGCAEGIASLIRNKERQQSLKTSCNNSDFENEASIKTFYTLLK